MHRKDFIKTCAFACFSAGTISALLESCGTSGHISAEISDSDMKIPLSAFQVVKNGEIKYRKYLIAQHNSLQFPICIYRFDEKNYSALWMQCTHQGAELQVFGDRLQCPAHGSEFTNTGKAENPPASENLRTFPVSIENNQLKISLK